MSASPRPRMRQHGRRRPAAAAASPARRSGVPGSGHVRSNLFFSTRTERDESRAATTDGAYVACLALAVVCCACGSGSADHAEGAAQHGAVITVGSFDFPESVLLADIYAGALTAQGFPVRVLPDLGPRELVDPALMSGLVQVVPEYSGSALEFASLGRLSATSDVTATGRALAQWAAGRGLVAGRPSAAQDANVIVVTAATAARYGLRSVAGLARAAPRLAFGGPPECPERIYCLLGLKQVYGLRFRVFIPLDAGGPLTLQALRQGTSGRAAVQHRSGHHADHLVVLADDRGLQPPRTCPAGAPGCRRPLRPRLLAVLNTVSARLTTGSLRALDARAELRGQDPRLVAESWLRTQGLASAGGASH